MKVDPPPGGGSGSGSGSGSGREPGSESGSGEKSGSGDLPVRGSDPDLTTSGDPFFGGTSSGSGPGSDSGSGSSSDQSTPEISLGAGPLSAVLGGSDLPPDPSDPLDPTHLHDLLNQPSPKPDTSGMTTADANAAMAEYQQRESLRIIGLGLSLMAPSTSGVERVGRDDPTVLVEAGVRANRADLAHFWTYTIRRMVANQEVKGTDTEATAALREFEALADLLHDWQLLRRANPSVADLAGTVAKLDNAIRSIQTRIEGFKLLWLDQASAIADGVARELGRQAAENLSGSSYYLASPVEGLAYSLRRTCSRYRGMFTVANRLGDAVDVLLKGDAFVAYRDSAAIKTAAGALDKAFTDYQNARLPPSEKQPNPPNLKTAIDALQSALTTMKTRLTAAVSWLKRPGGTSDPTDMDRIASVALYMAAVCDRVAAAESLFGKPFADLATPIRRALARDPILEFTSPDDLSDFWSTAQNTLLKALKPISDLAATDLKGHLDKIDLQGALLGWGSLASSMPATASDLADQAWTVAEEIASARAAINYEVEANGDLLEPAMDALDRLAMTIAQSMVSYAGLFPRQLGGSGS